MELLNFIFKLSCIALIPVIIMISAQIQLQYKNIKELTIKNHNTIMTTLADFQTVAATIEGATTTIAAYVQGTGMSAADQDAALKVVQDAAAKLVAAIPAPQVVAPAGITGTLDVAVGATTQLSDATPGGTWESSDTAVASVDANGNVTGIAAGQVPITYTVSGNATSVTVTVN